MMAVKSVNALSHYTNWNIAHVHGGALGWVGFMVFGMVYWLVPRLYQTKLYSPKLATTHFWISTVGIVLYVVSMWAAGITEGLMWRAFDDTGRLQFPDFVETSIRIVPMYWVRMFGGSLYIAGTLNFFFFSWYHAPMAVSVDDIAPPSRAVAAQGLVIFTMHLVGTAPSSYVIGLVSDYSSLYTAMWVPFGTLVLATLAMVAATPSFAADHLRARSGDVAHASL